MMRYIPDALRQLVCERANYRCEYCRLAQAGQAATFHIDHITPMSAGGPTVDMNLALAYVSCSLKKSARQSAVDPKTSQEASIYNPREQAWHVHFEWQTFEAVGLTPTGRATVDALDMNRSIMLAIREEEAFFDRHPPPD